MFSDISFISLFSVMFFASVCAAVDYSMCVVTDYPAPYTSGTRYCFRSICLFVFCLFVSLLARLRENGWTDLHEIFREGVE